MVFLSEGFIADLLNGITTNVTGSDFLTLLLIVFLIMGFAFAFRIPLEFTAILIFPLLLGMAAFSGSFMPILGVLMIYLAVLIAKNFFFWR